MKRVICALVLLAVGAATAVPVAAAPRAGIIVLEQAAVSHFPNDLTFRLRVRSDGGNITSAVLHLQIGWQGATRPLPLQPFTPAAEVELTGVWNTAGETIPPFIEITYYWEVSNSSGQTIRTEPATIEYVDTTHDWQRRQAEHVIVYWYGQDKDFGEAIFTAAQESYDHVARITGVTTERPIRVVIYASQRDFCAFYAPNTCQSWIGGQTFGDLGITVQWGSDLDWFAYNVVPHEMAHVFYDDMGVSTWSPTWFNEGIAVYNERHDHSEERELVLAAAEAGELRPLAVMTRGGGVAEGNVGLWYAIAYSVVAYIADEYGEDTLGELISLLGNATPFDQALAQATGLDMAGLEMGWRAWLGYPIDQVPTPIVLPTMAITPFSLPTAPRGQPAATRTPQPTVPTPTPQPTTPAIPCASLLIGVLPLALLAVRRQRRPAI
jgi:hypothetical protein